MCKSSRILVFNCSHEMALAANVKQYFPPKNIQQMEDDLCLLPLWWAEDGDAIVVDDVAKRGLELNALGEGCPKVVLTTWAESYDMLCLRAGRCFVPCPWGWNMTVRERFRRMSVDEVLLPTEEELSDLRSFASREFVVGYFDGIQSAMKELLPARLAERLVCRPPFFSKSISFDVPDGVRQLIFKSPWSSSGRGVFVADVPLTTMVTDRLGGFLRTQGGFLVDRFYDKVMDFAMEYFVRKDGTVDYLGLSVFDTGEEGRYGGNVVASQQKLMDILAEATGMPQSDAYSLMEGLAELHKAVLCRKLGGRYSGIAGVDMLLVRSNERVMVHPCIEINLRMNMGVLAMKVYDRISASGLDASECETALTQERKCGFIVRCAQGRLNITKS